MKRKLNATLWVIFFAAPGAWAQQTKPTLLVEPVKVELVKTEAEIPGDWLASFKSHIVDLLTNSQIYAKVLTAPEEKPEGALDLKISIVSFSKGNRTQRYMIGFGAGREKMKAVVLLTDSAGKALLQKDFQATTTMGIAGSKSGETPRKLAEQIVRAVISASHS